VDDLKEKIEIIKYQEHVQNNQDVSHIRQATQKTAFPKKTAMIVGAVVLALCFASTPASTALEIL